MVNFTALENSVTIQTEDKTVVVPKGKIMAIASEDSTSVTLRLMGSRKPFLSFPYNDCNFAQADAEQTAKKLAEIL